MKRTWRRLLRVPAAPVEQAHRDVEEEVAFHLEMRTEELVGRGLSRAEARAQAEREFGDVDRGRALLRREAVAREREELRFMMMDELKQDVRYGWRMLRERPGFTAVALLTLALGVAATTTIYTVYDAIVLSPLPVTDPDRVVVPRSTPRGSGEMWSITYADFLDWEERGVFAYSAVGQSTEADIRLGQEPERFNLALVTEEWFPALGARAALGRVLGPTDFRPDAPPALVLSHDAWQTRFGGDSSVIGRTVGSRRPATIVGVLEAGAEWPQEQDIWMPLQPPAGQIPSDWMERDNYMFYSVARLKPGGTIAQATAELDALARTIEQQNTMERANMTLLAVPLQQEVLGDDLPRALSILMIAVGFVLLIGCANIANLLLVRGSGRRREFAVRTAIGARPFRLARQLLTESLLLGLAGGILGCVLANWGVALLVHYAPAGIARINEVHLNAPVLALGLGASLFAAVLFGLAPMIQASRTSSLESLAHTTARSAGDRQGRRVRRTLVIGELALSIMLLVGAGLLVRSLLRLQQVDPGLQTANALTLSVRTGPQYDAPARTVFYQQLIERVRAIPGVQGATIGSALPLGGGGFYLGRAFLPEGRPEPPNGAEVEGQWNVVSPGYFATTGMRLMRGRDFTDQDRAETTPVMIINQKFADLMFPGENPIGKRVRSWRDENLLREVVGVVGNVRYWGADDEIRGLVYVPHTQNSWGTMTMIVRTERTGGELQPELRKAVASLDPNIAVANLSTLADARERSIARPRFSALLLAGFAVLALLLATIGIYGVLAYGVAQRTREFGVRMALGAHRADVVRLVLGEAMALVAAGVGIGLLGAFAGSRALGGLLFELDARDPITFVTVASLLTGVAMLASYIPARRATGVSPTMALRQE